MDVTDKRPSPLGNRFDEVCRVRGISARAWSLEAGLSERYLAVQRNRSADEPSYTLPEDAAAKLAEVARVSVDWLRFGRGTMEPAPPVSDARKALLEDLSRHVGHLIGAGDMVVARRVSELLAELIALSARADPVPARSVHDGDTDVESGQRLRLAAGDDTSEDSPTIQRPRRA